MVSNAIIVSNERLKNFIINTDRKSSSIQTYIEASKARTQEKALDIKKPKLEIKIALVGNVSAGKTTVLNALLQDRYGEVAKKRTTAGAHYFYLKVPTASGSSTTCECSPEAIYEEIKEDNQRKLSNGNEIGKKVFHIEIPEPLIRCRDDIGIVLVDIPGINEAGTDNKNKDFVSSQWTTFDCVVVCRAHSCFHNS